MPLFGLHEGSHIRAVTLPEYTEVSPFLRSLYFGVFTLLPLFGLLEFLTELARSRQGKLIYRYCSITLSSASILLFAVSRQPYITALLFLLFMVKVLLLIHETRLG